MSATATPIAAEPRPARAPRLRAIPRRVPVAAWVACVAILNAACWSIVTPAFQVSDEQAHFAYVKQVAESGRLPHAVTESFSTEETLALAALRFLRIGGEPGTQTIASQAEQDQLRRELARAAQLPRDGGEAAGVATAEPPLYYAFEAVPYLIASGGTVLDRLQLMRLFSSLLAGCTALFAFLFVREALPGEPWAWSTAGFGVALTPLLGFMSGAVTSEAGLYAVASALFFCLARAFRRGLTRRLAAGLGAVVALGVLTKLNFVGLLPGVAVGVAFLCRRVARTSRAEALRRLALLCALAAGPIVLAAALGMLAYRGGLTAASENLAGLHRSSSLGAKLSYAWQLYLPRLPGMASYFPDISTTRQIWFDGFVGLYGWSDTPFPEWVYELALGPAAVLGCLFIKGAAQRSESLRARAGELGVYALMGLGILAMVAIASYSLFPKVNAEFARERYLLPLVALLGAALALAARGAGRRWGPATGALIVMLMLAHDLFSQLLVVGHYYA